MSDLVSILFLSKKRKKLINIYEKINKIEKFGL